MTRMSVLLVARGDGENGVSTSSRRAEDRAYPGACRLRQPPVPEIQGQNRLYRTVRAFLPSVSTRALPSVAGLADAERRLPQFSGAATQVPRLVKQSPLTFRPSYPQFLHRCEFRPQPAIHRCAELPLAAIVDGGGGGDERERRARQGRGAGGGQLPGGLRVPDPGPELALRRRRDRHRRGRAAHVRRLRGEDRARGRGSARRSTRSAGPSARGCAGSRPSGWPRTASGSTRSASTWWACCATAPTGSPSSTSGGWARWPLARTFSVALVGVSGHLIEVEADIASGLPATILVGLPDTALREARDRIRAAIVNSGESWPNSKITVGLSPAALPKRGSRLRPGHRGGHPRRRRRAAAGSPGREDVPGRARP